MTKEESKSRQTWLMLVVPGILSTILLAVIGLFSWAALEYWTSYKELVKSEMTREDLSGKLSRVNSELQGHQKKALSLNRELQNANEKLAVMTEELSACSTKDAELTKIKNELSNLQQLKDKCSSEVAQLEFDSIFDYGKLGDAEDANKKLQEWIDRRNVTLQSCDNRPTNIVNSAALGYVDGHSAENVAPPNISNFAQGEAWIHVVSIGRDGNGNFATAYSSVFENPEKLFCIRPHDAFQINSKYYLTIVSIGEHVSISDQYFLNDN